MLSDGKMMAGKMIAPIILPLIILPAQGMGVRLSLECLNSWDIVRECEAMTAQTKLLT
jgi:hypothetical protein